MSESKKIEGKETKIRTMEICLPKLLDLQHNTNEIEIEIKVTPP